MRTDVKTPNENGGPVDCLPHHTILYDKGQKNYKDYDLGRVTLIAPCAAAESFVGFIDRELKPLYPSVPTD